MKTNNSIIIGGPIAVGKSTLASALPFPSIPELDENNKILDLILEGTYKKDRVSPEVIEFFFLEMRKQKYLQYSNTLTTHIFDRSILDSVWFAEQNMSKSQFKHFRTYWKNEVLDLFKEHGKPMLYILLTLDWDTFKERIYKRNRDVEIKNFLNNENFFQKHVKEYEKHIISILNEFEVSYIIIDTRNIDADEVKRIVLEKMGEKHV